MEHLGWLLQYMNQTFPDARLALSALIPNAEVDVGPANERLAALADEHGLLFFDCGGDLETGTSQYIDETHLAEDGQLVWISCMKEATRGMWSQEEGVGAVLGSGDGAAGGDRTVYST